MPKGTLEHVNISVSDPERMADLLGRLAGWRRRWEGPSLLGGRTIHCGDDNAYVALYHHPEISGPFAKGLPLQHVALVVDDLDAAQERLRSHAVEYRYEDHGNALSLYFDDPDGHVVELTTYVRQRPQA